MFGILLIDKPAGITSHGVISRLRRILGTRRVGHAGTLDPLATGLLVVAVGPATRFLQYLDLEPKTYEAEITFGVATNTYDSEGEVTDSKPVPKDLFNLIEQNLHEFTGKIEQFPPAYSAVKHLGKPLYAYARKGEEVERKARSVFISQFSQDSIDGPTGQFTVVCSGGTYVRSLAHDLGQAVGCGAHISALRRTRAGQFLSVDATSLDEVGPSDLIPVKDVLAHLPQIHLDPGQVECIRHGRPITIPDRLESPKAALLTPDGNVVGIGSVVKESTLHPECVIPAEVFDQFLSTP